MRAGCETEAMTSELSRRVGELAGRAGHEDVVDVAVVEGAARRGDDVIVTSNEAHILQVTAATGQHIRSATV